ncbi:MAG: hypothetical protein ACYTEL_08680 [Planctomycetota bacterium]|jgi:hypothetical protein
MESDWLREVLFLGQSGKGFELGTALSCGWFWMRVGGCVLLYRGQSMEEIDLGTVLQASEADVLEISPPSYLSHDREAIYYYVLRWVNRCGVQEQTLLASVRVRIDGDGELADRRPNSIFIAGAEQVDGDKVRLVWYYHAIAQESAPVRFNVYGNNGTGEIDFESPVATVDYNGRGCYRHVSGSVSAGRYQFCVRAEDADGTEGGFPPPVRVQVGDMVPSAVEILSAEGA